MKENYHKKKLEEARIAAIQTYREQIDTIASLTDINLEDPDEGLSLKERINDIEIALCELLDIIVPEEE